MIQMDKIQAFKERVRSYKPQRVLIVIDFQHDFIDGSLVSPQAQAIVPNVIKKINEYNERGDLVIFTQDTHYYDYLETQEGTFLPVEHCITYTEGWEIYENIDKNITNVYIERKSSFGYFDWDDNSLSKITFGRPEIEIIGLVTDICVISNALILKSLYPEFIFTVDASCCAGTTDEAHKAALLVMKSCQINVINE